MSFNLSSTTRIGWIGTGVMGASMAAHLQKAGYTLHVFNRSKEKAGHLIENGAVWCESPAVVAEGSELVFTIVGFPHDVREVYFGSNGIMRTIGSGSICIDMTTTAPSLAEEIHNVGKQKGVGTIDAPVSGGDVGAKNGSLSIMIGGDEEDVNKVMPLLQLMGKNIVYEGEAGAGQHTKMCNQITIAGTMVGVCEALLYGSKAGLDLTTMLSAISGGAAGCWSLDNLAPRIVNRNFDPGFYVEHFVKDMEIALDEAKRMNLALPGLAIVHQLYKAVEAQGHGRMGTHALTMALEKMNGA